MVQIKVPLETPNPFASAAPSVFGVTRQRHFLNHVQRVLAKACEVLNSVPDDEIMAALARGGFNPMGAGDGDD